MARQVLMMLLLLALSGGAALGDIKGERVVRGKVAFDRSADLTTITAGNNSIINYQGFDIAGHETVQFVQPHPQARVLNRIVGADPTQIDGSLLANGVIYLVNPAGVYFGPGSIIDVGGFYSAAANITDADFLNNINHFIEVNGEVVNEGTILGDAVHLIGRKVANYGTIVSEGGHVMLLAGSDVFIGERDGNILIKIDEAGAGDKVGPPRAEAGIDDTGSDNIQGKVILGAGDIYSLAIRGHVKAGDITVQGGNQDRVEVAGRLDASNPDGQGGTVKVLGGQVELVGAEIDASGGQGGGEVLVGGDYQGQGELPTSSVTYVDSETTINANAVDTGAGGKVIVWADQAAFVRGTI
ncbi:MAG: hypothetical protein AMJ79_09655, partial [Phycisphaerae bacterium SM23_30]